MNPLEEARKLILDYHFPKEMKETWEDIEEGEYYNGKNSVTFESPFNQTMLSQSLHYFIEIRARKVQEKDVPLGASKQGGSPHWPTSLKWPKDYLFYAQINIADFKRYDIEDLFPDKGIIYFFVSDDDPEDTKVLFYDGDIKNLAIQETEDTVSEEVALYLYKPGVMLYVKDLTFDLYAKIDELIPYDLEKKLLKVVKCDLAEDDPDLKILGRPRYWQGEDMSSKSSSKQPENNKVLILQDEHGEGQVHFWMPKEGLKKKDFSKASSTYSGT